MIAEFSEHNNTPRNPRKHRRLDDDPPDTGDPRGPSPPPHPGQSAPTNPVSPTIRINLLGALASEEEEAIDEDEIEILEGDVTTSIVDGIINIDFSDRIRDLAIKSLDQTVVVKLLGRPTSAESDRLDPSSWPPSHALQTQHYSGDRGCIGSVACIDYQRDSGHQGCFARMTVTIDLHEPLVSKLVINGCVQLVEYESLPTICFSCRKYEYVLENFPLQTSSNPLQFSETMEPTRLPEFAAKGKSVVPKPSKVSELSKPVINVRKTLSVSRNMPTSRFANSASSSSTLPYVPPLSKPIDRGNHSDKNSQSLPPGEPPDVQGVQGARTTLDGIDLSLQGRSTIPSNLIIASASILDMSVDVAVVNVTS
ncbi:hypothetical protein V6N12_058697 [Hibiscus sabdariffa]|uniref:Uncharacterized protein n=1 Tax=Hibiscus sabdariffa TaxID=183260 RepID=A0ABR2ESV4_9ROSI